MVTIIQGTTKKPVSARRLANYFAVHPDFEGYLYLGYPIIGTSEGPFPIDAVLVSRERGVVIFNLVEGRDLANYQESQDDCANKIEAKLRAHKTLMNGRVLQVEIHTATFAPLRDDASDLTTDNHPVCNEANLDHWLTGLKWSTPEYYEPLVAVLQAISTIRKGRKKRDVQRDDSRGSKLKSLEESIANLDNLQGRAVIETVDGVQRIRGLAGSGKTIVLALKAAYLHTQHPEWKIAVTFNTRSLKGQFRQLINTFAIEQSNEEPDWENLHIIHAWGAPGGGDRNGIYYAFCQAQGIEYHDFKSAKGKFGQGREFEGACQKALHDSPGSEGQYDAILIDEAQDFPPAFLRLCYEFLKPEKRLVYAYDELQNLSSNPLPSPEEIFGNDAEGTPRVRFTPQQAGRPQQDIILERCYRNSRPILVTAHALGFGIYRTPDPRLKTGLVQIFDHSQLWLDVGYEVTSGALADGQDVTLSRTDHSSPLFLERHSRPEDLIEFHCFATKEKQAQWLVKSIKGNLTKDELRPDDIVVINPDPLTTRDEVGPIRKLLFQDNINSHLAGVDTSPDVFFDADCESVAFTGIYRAKGNEAGMIYIINAQDCYSSFGNLAGVRNRLFTAITRSKAWVRVLGVGESMQRLMQEFEQIKSHGFELRFKYPSAGQRKHINIVNRDMTEDERKRVLRNKDEFTRLLDDIEAGKVYWEDLGPELLARLKSLFGKGPS